MQVNNIWDRKTDDSEQHLELEKVYPSEQHPRQRKEWQLTISMIRKGQKAYLSEQHLRQEKE